MGTALLVGVTPRTRRAVMFRYYFISVDRADNATTIKTLGCENDSIAWRQAHNLLSLDHSCIEVWRDGALVHRVGHGPS